MHIIITCPILGELIEDMESFSETSTDPLDTTKDTSNLGAKISEEAGIAALINSSFKLSHIAQLIEQLYSS